GVSGARRQLRPERIDLVANFLDLFSGAAVEVEHHDDHGLARLRRRLQRIEAGDGIHRILDGLDDIGFDRLWRGSGIGHHYSNDRKVYVGQLFDRQALIGIDTEYHDGDHDHGRKHWVV